MSEQNWVEDEDLERIVAVLGSAVVGLPNERDNGRPISSDGVGTNCAAAFKNDVFAIRDFCWCGGSLHPETDWEEDENYLEMPPSGGDSDTCPMNFEHYASGIKGTWYKYMGRGEEFNRNAAPGEAQRILMDCLSSLGQATKK